MPTDIRSVAFACAVLVIGLGMSAAITGAVAAEAPPPSGEETSAPSLDPAPADPNPAVGDAAAAPSDAESPEASGEASLVPAPGPDPDAPVVLDGPLRPKGTLPPSAARPTRGDDDWSRSFEGGLRWKKGDTAVTLSGAPFSRVRIGGTISR